MKRGTTEDWFWEKVSIGPDVMACWEWIAARDAQGYGVFQFNKKPAHAHRVVWALLYEDPGPRFVLHRCDNPPCVNPAHLFIGTAADNRADMVSKGRDSFGVRHGLAKLNPEKIREMRSDYASGEISQAALAARYGVSQATIWSALARKTWPHVA